MSGTGTDLTLVELDQDHPGFRDPAYRARRNAIASQALSYNRGEPEPEISYQPVEHAVWSVVSEHLAPLHARYACQAYIDGSASLCLAPTAIPQLSDINRRLSRTTGFRMSPVAGLVAPRIFLTYLARDVFLSTQYVRHHSAPLYTPEPDVIHELVGHAPLLAQPALAGLNRLFGQAAEAADDVLAERLIRLYWYTLEFGLVKEDGMLKAIGAGLLSSFGELERFESESIIRPFDLEAVSRTPFDPTTYQPTLFVAEGAATLIDELTTWLRKPFL